MIDDYQPRFVYFAWRRGLIKIGCSAHLWDRMCTLRARLLGCILGDFDEERRLHSVFDADAAVGEGLGQEWFTPSPRLMRFIDRLGPPPSLALDEPLPFPGFAAVPRWLRCPTDNGRCYYVPAIVASAEELDAALDSLRAYQRELTRAA